LKFYVEILADLGHVHRFVVVTHWVSPDALLTNCDQFLGHHLDDALVSLNFECHDVGGVLVAKPLFFGRGWLILYVLLNVIVPLAALVHDHDLDHWLSIRMSSWGFVDLV